MGTTKHVLTIGEESKNIPEWAKVEGANTENTIRLRYSKGMSHYNCVFGTVECNPVRVRSEESFEEWIGSLGLMKFPGFWFHAASGICIVYHLTKEHTEEKVGRIYHHDLWRKFRAEDKQLLQVFEHEWVYKTQLVKNMLIYKMGLSKKRKVQARKCEIVDLELPDAHDFLNKWHILGSTLNMSVMQGLKYNDEIVALSGFGRCTQGADWVMHRFCTGPYIVNGAFGKLLKSFRNEHRGTIKTFADLAYSDGGCYEQFGFQGEIANDSLNHRFVHPETLVTHDKRLFRDGKVGAPKSLLKVWDCGKMAYTI